MKIRSIFKSQEEKNKDYSDRIKRKNTNQRLCVLVYKKIKLPYAIRKQLNKGDVYPVTTFKRNSCTGFCFDGSSDNYEKFQNWLLTVLPEDSYFEIGINDKNNDTQEVFVAIKKKDKIDKIKLTKDSVDELYKIIDAYLAKNENEESIREERGDWWNAYVGFRKEIFLTNNPRFVTKEFVNVVIDKIDDEEDMIFETNKIIDPFLLRYENNLESLNKPQKIIHDITSLTVIIVDEGIEQFYSSIDIIEAADYLGLRNISKMMHEYFEFIKSMGAVNDVSDLDLINPEIRWTDAFAEKEKEFSRQFIEAWNQDRTPVVIKKFIKDNIDYFIDH